MFGPILRGELISLEPPRHEDAARRCRWFADLELSHYWTNPTVPSRAQEEETYARWATSEPGVYWRIVREGETIGSAHLFGIDWINRHALQGTVMGERDHWGKGYGSEVVRLRTAYAFDELNLERLETSSLTGNIGMHRALERSGFRPIGRRRRRYFVDGEWLDEVIFELRRDRATSEACGSRD